MVRVTLSTLLVILTNLHYASSNLGTSFLVTCPDSLLASTYIEYMLYVNSPDSSTNIVVATPLLGSNIFTGSVGQGESKEILLSSTYLIRGTGTSSYAVVINSTSDVSVYVVLKPGGDGYMALPVDALGTEYYVMTYCDHSGHKPCQFTITAAEPSTQIEVTLTIINPSATVNLTGTIYRHGDIITETLIQYQTLQIQCEYDLTGTLIVANRRVAVIGGGAGSTVSLGATAGVLLEQYPPVSTYGTEILAIPSQFVKSAPGDYYRILVAHPFTTIQIGGQNRKLIREAGDWFQTNISAISVITSDKPIVVARLTLSSETVPSDERPTLMILVPTEQFLPKSTSVLVPKSNTPDNKVILVSKTPGHTSIQINLNLQDLGWTPVVGTNLVIKYYTTNAFNAQQISSPLASFTVYYQTNSDEYSTSYAGGMKYEVSNPPCTVGETGHGDTVDNDCDGLIDEDDCPFYIDPAVSGQDCKDYVSGARDSYGRRFVMAFPGNMQELNVDALYLVFSSLSSSAVTVTVKTPLNDTRLLISRSFLTSDYISFSDEFEIHGEGVSDLGILIESSEEISVYSLSVKYNPDSSAGATRLIPTESIGKEYYAVTTCLTGICQITIVAVHPVTLVKARLHFSDSSTRLRYGGRDYYSGDVITETLSQYQVWQLESADDLTGTHILGNKPISVFSGANSTQFKNKHQTDQMTEQLFPVNAWGKEFVVIQTPGRMGANCYFTLPSCADAVRVVAAEADTTLTVKLGCNGIGSTYNLHFPGDWIRFDLMNETACITSNKGVSVNQLMSDGVKGDAAFLVIVPVEQYVSMDILRNVPASEPGATAINNLMLSTETDFESSIFVNNKPIVPPWETLPGGRSFYRTEVTDNDTRVSTANSSIRVGGYFYVNMDPMYSSHIFSIASFFLWINTPCEITDVIVGDGKDNDCDGAIDEEPCDESSPEDADMDGMFNEDCAQPIESSTTLIPSSTDLSTSQDVSPSTSLIATDLSTSQDVSPSTSSIATDLSPSQDVSLSTSLIATDLSTSQDNAHSTFVTSTGFSGSAFTSIISPTVAQLSSFVSNSASTELLPTPSTVTYVDPNSSSFGYVSQTLPYNIASNSSHPSSVFVMTSGESVCSCGCITWSITTTLASQSLVEVTDSIKQELTVDAKEVSQTKRRYISVPDPRISAQTVGYFGVATISCIFIGIVILDAGALFKDIVALIQTCKEVARK